MAAKSAASKKRKKATTSKRKVAARKVSKKKVARKKAAGKTVARKKASKKKPARTKVSRKKASKKKVAKKASKKKAVSRKKVAKKASKKKAVSRKKVAKKASKKKASKKKVASKTRPVARKKVARKAPVRRARSRGDLLTGPIHGVGPYKSRRGEDYMGETQLGHFQDILAAWKEELIFEVDRTVHHMQDEAANFPDPNDRATQESEFGLELRTRDRERKLLRKIDSALIRIDDGSYGFCDETGEEIGLKRLEARPVATLCLEAQERREQAERQFRDRDDRYR
ncbi:MAG: RNA polymerase-binding protein DksA [Gammaproteobacteria bacterium]|nr:MAG: RNA polymerase-binding protein DksA [Gammaproteobacteria bacterium]